MLLANAAGTLSRYAVTCATWRRASHSRSASDAAQATTNVPVKMAAFMAGGGSASLCYIASSFYANDDAPGREPPDLDRPRDDRPQAGDRPHPRGRDRRH